MESAHASILIVDDEPLTAEFYQAVLAEHGYSDTVLCHDSRVAMELVSSKPLSVILLDLNMPHVSGEQLLPQITERHPEIPVVVITAVDRIETAVDCMKQGAFDFMTKPVDEARMVGAVRNARRLRELQDQVQIMQQNESRVEPHNPERFRGIITVSPLMKRVFVQLEAIAATPWPVLITGESGTGKELIARAVHDLSGRSGEFVAVNVAGLDGTMFSDTLFGHRKGAFTGADGARQGLIEQANRGTLFLDEIGDLDQQSQVKLLRLLQEGEYYPLGADRPSLSGARVVVATNADLELLQQEGAFRRDLYYRLVSHRIQLPPLRDRAEDIPVLFTHFLHEACDTLERSPPELQPELLEYISRYRFPGNVRELQALIYDVVGRNSGERVTIDAVRGYLQGVSGSAPDAEAADAGGDGAEVPTAAGLIRSFGGFPKLKDVESWLIDEALRISGGNQSAAASMLGVSQSTISRRAKPTKDV